jgi:hypothetical protein
MVKKSEEKLKTKAKQSRKAQIQKLPPKINSTKHSGCKLSPLR